MKILKIFGVVVAIHALIGLFVIAIPGCRTASRSVPPAPATEANTSAPTVSYPGANAAPGDATPSMSGSDLNPGTTSGSPTVSFNGAPATQHFNPTRPGTPVANVLESGDVTGVTPASTYKVQSNDSLWKVAKKHGIGVDDLAKANKLRPDSPLKVGQKLIIPGKPAPTSASGGASGSRTYTVKAGETIGTIARKQGVSVTDIRSLNPQLKNDVVRVGQELTLPASGSSAAATTAAVPATTPVAPSSATPAPSGSIEYTVRPGEGLGQIAKKFGVPQKEIAIQNNIANPTSLRAGQKLIIPGVKTPSAAPNVPSVTPPVDQGPVVPSTPNETPVTPASPMPEAGPVTSTSQDGPPPPVVKVEETAPVSPSK